jgi:hypothetical protein
MDCILYSVKRVYIDNAIKMPSIIITYLVMLRLDCVIEVSLWGILCIEFKLFVFSLCWLVQLLFGGYSLEAVWPRWQGVGCLCSYMLLSPSLRTVDPCHIGLVGVMCSSLVRSNDGRLWLFTAVFVQFLRRIAFLGAVIVYTYTALTGLFWQSRQSSVSVHNNSDS